MPRKRTGRMVERNQQIVDAVTTSGGPKWGTFKRVGEQFGVSVTRVKQIWDANTKQARTALAPKVERPRGRAFTDTDESEVHIVISKIVDGRVQDQITFIDKIHDYRHIVRDVRDIVLTPREKLIESIKEAKDIHAVRETVAAWLDSQLSPATPKVHVENHLGTERDTMDDGLGTEASPAELRSAGSFGTTV